MSERRPKGYRGEKHETIGSDVLAVLKVVNFPETALGAELAATLQAMTPTGWYPIQPLLDAMERLDRKLGRSGLVQLGRNVFRSSHEGRVKREAVSAADVLMGFDAMYRHANRGRDIGGWKIIELVPGKARLEKTTPHHCVMEEGILLEALSAVGVSALVSQKRCFRTGADLCEYEVAAITTDAQWLGRWPRITAP